MVFVLNHPNGLIDPLFILCHAPRVTTFLGKAPLFRMPVIGWFARELEAIPVYRMQDPGSPMEKNRTTFARAMGVSISTSRNSFQSRITS